MENPNLNIFRIYDIRGVPGRDFDDAFAQRLGARVAAYLKAGMILVGRDARTSSDALAYAAVDGAMHTGAKVIDIGVVSSPQLYWAVRSLGAQGGIMVTASHNPDTDNGFKVIDGQCHVIGGDRLRQIYDAQSHSHRPDGTVETRDITPDYADAIAYASGWQGGAELHIALDGPPSVLRVLERLGPIAPDSGLAARFDTDGDRISCYVDGQMLPAEWVFLTIAEHFHLAPLVFDLRFSRVVRESLEQRGVDYTTSRVGRLFLTEAMRHTGAPFGGEMSGHFYWKEFNAMEAPELTLLRFLQATGQDAHRVHKLIPQYRRYAKSDELNIPITDRKHALSVLEHIAGQFPGCALDRTDGISVDCWDSQGFWFNLRFSNTEPLLRLVVESKSKDMLDEKTSQLMEILRR